MKIIMSPAKKMRVDNDASLKLTEPIFLEKSYILENKLKSMSYDDLKALWKTNDVLTHKCYDELMNRSHIPYSAAIYAYEGIAFKYLHPYSLTDNEIQYLNDHLCILSGFYGLLRPSDAIRPYRLEMGVKALKLYDFWGKDLYDALNDHIIINLASQEYSKCIEDHLTDQDLFIEIKFLREVDHKLKQQATYAKMARGAMISYLAKNQANNLDDLKKFNDLGFVFREELSHDHCYVFVQSEGKDE